MSIVKIMYNRRLWLGLSPYPTYGRSFSATDCIYFVKSMYYVVYRHEIRIPLALMVLASFYYSGTRHLHQQTVAKVNQVPTFS